MIIGRVILKGKDIYFKDEMRGTITHHFHTVTNDYRVFGTVMGTKYGFQIMNERTSKEINKCK